MNTVAKLILMVFVSLFVLVLQTTPTYAHGPSVRDDLPPITSTLRITVSGSIWDIAPPVRAVGYPSKYWKAGTTLQVYFDNASEAERQRVQEVVAQWTQYANIILNFHSEFPPPQDSSTKLYDADILIHFEGSSGGWSYVGTDSKAYAAKLQPSIQLPYDLSERVILHEFGHALGLLHEHQTPANTPINWNKTAVYEYFSKNFKWSKAEVDAQLFAKLDKTLTQYTDYDEKSIMNYYILPEWTTDGYSVGLNERLSEVDRRFIAKVYQNDLTNGGFQDNTYGWNFRATNFFVYQSETDPFLATNDYDNHYEQPSIFQDSLGLSSDQLYKFQARVSGADTKTILMVIWERGNGLTLSSSKVYTDVEDWRTLEVTHYKRWSDSILTSEIYYLPHEGDMRVDFARLWKVDNLLGNGGFLSNTAFWQFRSTNYFVYQEEGDPFLATNDYDKRFEQPSVFQNVYGLPSNREYTFSARVKSTIAGRSIGLVIRERTESEEMQKSEKWFDVGEEWQDLTVGVRKQVKDSSLTVEIYYVNGDPAADIYIDHAILTCPTEVFNFLILKSCK